MLNRCLSVGAVVAAVAAVVVACLDDYDDAYWAGAAAICSQLTGQAGRLSPEGVCEVAVDGVFLRPRVDIRRPLEAAP